MRVTQWVLTHFIPNYQDSENIDVRTRVGLLEGWASVIANTLLFVIKGGLGWMVGSVSLIADAVHTLSDSLTSVVVIFGFRMAGKPPDEEHPFGHGRMESIAAVIIGVLLAVVSFETLRAAIGRVIHPKPLDVPHWVIAVVVVTILVKEALARLSFGLGRHINSQALIADGWHHRSDVLATAMVVLAFIGMHWDLNRLDGIMGIGVAIMIAWASYETLRSAMGPLIGERAPAEMYVEIERIARATPGVYGVHDILVNRYGFLNIISLHIEVSATETAMRLHELCDDIELKLGQRYGGHATVHVDPLNTDHPHYEAVRQVIGEAVAEEQGLAAFHDLRLIGGEKRFTVVFDAAPKPGKDISLRDLRARVTRRLRARFPRVRVVIDLEPPYFHNVGLGASAPDALSAAPVESPRQPQS